MNNLEKPVYVSADGLKKIQAELDDLKSAGRQKVAERIPRPWSSATSPRTPSLSRRRTIRPSSRDGFLTLEQMVKNAQIIDEESEARDGRDRQPRDGGGGRLEGAVRHRRIGGGGARGRAASRTSLRSARRSWGTAQGKRSGWSFRPARWR